MHFSLSEFAFVLLFLSMGTAAVLLRISEEAQQEADRYAREARTLRAGIAVLHEDIQTLELEVAFLNEMLAEYRHGVVPCWRRPDTIVPPVAGRIVIHHRDRYSIRRTGAAEAVVLDTEPSTMATDLEEVIRTDFADQMQYAAENRCYVRIGVKNETNSFRFYQDVVDVVRRTAMVVVNE